MKIKIVLFCMVIMPILANEDREEMSLRNMTYAVQRIVNCLQEKGLTRFIEKKNIGFGSISTLFRQKLTDVRILLVKEELDHNEIFKIIQNYICSQLNRTTELIAHGHEVGCHAEVKECCEVYNKYLFQPRTSWAKKVRNVFKAVNAFQKYPKKSEEKINDEPEEDQEGKLKEKPKEDPEEKTEELKEKTEELKEKPEEKIEEEPKENLEEKIEELKENPEEKIEEPKENPEEKIEEPKENPEGEPKEDPEEKIEEELKEDPEEKTEELKEKPEEKIEEEPKENLEEKIEEPKENPEEKIEEPKENPQEKIEEEPKEKPEEEPKEKSEEKPENISKVHDTDSEPE